MKKIFKSNILVNESGAPNVLISTRSVHGISSDPFNFNRFASFADDGIIRIWDIRKPNETISFFSNLYYI